MYDLGGRVALVTGAAGSGIGKATARRLLAEGAAVAVTDVHERRTEETVAELAAEHGDRVIGLLLDAGDRAQIDAAVAATAERLGPIDILVNNAAVNVVKPVADMTPEEWDWATGVNLSGPWYLCRAVLPSMKERGRGWIVNVTSVAGWIHGTGEGPYAGAKAALHQLTRTIATEYGPFGVRCNGVAPGIIRTWFIERHAPHLADEIPRTPLRRLGQPEDIAAVIAWLCSDESSFVTGETINASGGWYVRP